MNAIRKDKTAAILIQPPFVQLNAPYPAPYYLKAFLESQGVRVRTADHSISLFGRIFCRAGLERVFTDARPLVQSRLASAWDDRDGTEAAVRENLSRYLSQERAWTATIERTVAFLRGEDREFGHLLAAANGALPAGDRTIRFIDESGGAPGPEDAARIATLMIADLADFIRVVLDPSFSLVRYAESIAASVRLFADAEKAVHGYVLETFYAPILAEEWAAAEKEASPTEEAPLIAACTVPFPGCLAGALFAAGSAKNRFGRRVRTVLGGGYVNTELRSIRSLEFFDTVDFLSFDRGYGSLKAIIDLGGKGAAEPLYRTVFRSADRTALIGGADLPVSEDDPYAAIDAAAPVRVFPDYRGVDFSRYILPVDDRNPMHRLWSDGRWMKAYLAHGCYWHSCAFCDVQLDYIGGYVPVDVDALFTHLTAQAAMTGVRGVHLVDEAAPPEALLRLAQLNRAAGLPLVFWGNIRFERTFTPDAAAVLAAGGLLGVSAGIEVASERGFKRLGKGIGLADVVRACAAFKEAGILVHAYLIFGFWDEDDGEILDSAETMRQLFRAGLVDSAFWHKFVLTRHSRIMKEKCAGRHANLAPLGLDDGQRDFADNDLRFEGESRTDRWSAPLDALVAAWMEGEELDSPVAAVLPFSVPEATVRDGAVEAILDDYARGRDSERERMPGPDCAGTPTAFFLGSEPVSELDEAGNRVFRWTYRYERRTLVRRTSSDEPRRLLAEAASGIPTAILLDGLKMNLKEREFASVWRELRAAGLVLVPFAYQPLPAGTHE